MRLLRRVQNAKPPTMAERVERARALIEAAPSPATPVYEPTEDRFPGVDGLPDIPFDDLTVDLLASGVQHHGGMVVRGLLTATEVNELRTYLEGGTVRAKRSGSSSDEIDRMVASLVAAYEARGVLDLVERYLGEKPIGFPHRTVVKRNERSAGLPWHQDASFFRGRCGSLDIWTALTPCGKDCPSLGLVPRRVDRVFDADQTTVGSSGAVDAEVAALLDGVEPVRPVLEPGDAILLDEMTVHRTGSGWKVPSRDVAITWFFAPSRLPQIEAHPIAF